MGITQSVLFNTLEYLALFLPAVFIGFFVLCRTPVPWLAKLLLLLASLFFYAYWKAGYLPLLLASILVNYGLGAQLQKSLSGAMRLPMLVLGVAFNLCLLGWYKYYDFLVVNLNTALQLDLETSNLLLPLAISFYTFQQIAYLVDAYRGQVAAPGFLNYSLFVCFFPQLIAGPIVHHSKMVPQFSGPDFFQINADNLRVGLFFIAVGLFKKSVLADALSPIVAQGFGAPSALAPHEAVFVILAYSFQLYFDFSGYTDMAMGAARLFNIHLPINFNSPYLSRNIREFWRRWHMTLNDFMTRYVYGPLRGRKRSAWRSNLAVFTTFMLVGIWHGAGWNFVLFGFMHAVAVLFLALGRFPRLPGALAIAVTFVYFLASLVLFRAGDVTLAMQFYSAFLDFGHYTGAVVTPVSALALGAPELSLLLFCGLLCFFCRNSNQLATDPWVHARLMPFGLALFIIAFSINTTTSEFIYFNF